MIEKRIDAILHELEQSHLRSIRRRRGVHVDVGVHFCPVCKKNIKQSMVKLFQSLTW